MTYLPTTRLADASWSIGVGASAGVGINLWLTNATRPCELGGTFHTMTFSIAALVGVNLQISKDDCGHWFVSAGPSAGAGVYVGGNDTDTWETGTW